MLFVLQIKSISLICYLLSFSTTSFFLMVWELRLLTHSLYFLYDLLDRRRVWYQLLKLTCRCHLRSNLGTTGVLWGGQSKIYQFPPCCLPTALVVVVALCCNLSSLQLKTGKKTKSNMDASIPSDLKHVKTTEKHIWHGTLPGCWQTFCALFGVMWLFQFPYSKRKKL